MLYSSPEATRSRHTARSQGNATTGITRFLVQSQDTKLLLYQQRAERLIAMRERKNYQAACIHLAKARALY